MHHGIASAINQYIVLRSRLPCTDPKYLDLLFLAFLENSKENHQKKQGFLLLAKPLKSLGKKGKMLMFEERPLPRFPQHPTIRVETWLSRMCCLGIPKWPMPFWLKSKALLRRIQRELPASTSIVHQCMQEGDQEEEEPLPLLYQVPLPRLLSWSRWWHITSRVLLIAYQKRFWGLLGNYLKLPEVAGVVNPHLARVRLSWGRGRGRLLRQLSDYAPK